MAKLKARNDDAICYAILAPRQYVALRERDPVDTDVPIGAASVVFGENDEQVSGSEVQAVERYGEPLFATSDRREVLAGDLYAESDDGDFDPIDAHQRPLNRLESGDVESGEDVSTHAQHLVTMFAAWMLQTYLDEAEGQLTGSEATRIRARIEERADRVNLGGTLFSFVDAALSLKARAP